MEPDAIAADIRTLPFEPMPQRPPARTDLQAVPGPNVFDPDFERRAHPDRFLEAAVDYWDGVDS